MAGNVTWTQTAWVDVEATADYIAKDSPRYAAAFVREVRDAARSLSHFAERGRVVPEFNDPSIRELFVRSFRLIYQKSEQQVYVLALVHGARDLRSLWQREGRWPVEDSR
jgi:plasmid stabilization system protein ParE